MKYKDYKTIRKIKKRKRQLQVLLRVGSFIVAIIVALGMVVSYKVSKEKKKSVPSNIDVKQKDTTAEEIPSALLPETETKDIYPQISSIYIDIQSEEVESPYMALLDVTENEIIAGRNVNERIYPASMTKIMTMIVVIEKLADLNQTTQIQEQIIYDLYLQEASMIGYEGGDTATAKDLLYGLILQSGADASTALAIMTAGSEEAFAELMNQKCTELGLTNTHFMNSSGLFDENQYTTPIEMAMILQYAMQNPICAEILNTRTYVTAPTVSSPDGIWLTNGMFSKMEGYEEIEGVTLLGGKTGYTDEARHCLVSCASKGDKLYIALIAGALRRAHMIEDTLTLYQDYLPAY